MREIVSYYLLALNLIGGFWLIYAIIATELRKRQERRERERVLAPLSEIKRLKVSRLTEQQQLWTCDANDNPEILEDGILGEITQLQTELNRRAVGKRAVIY